MKIEKIHLKNLNSLAGSWTIDFTDPTYAHNPIFAITGPTGSGKSTLIDAIGLALYAKTPRMNKVTQTTNEILTKGQTECLAEVQFVVGNLRYIARMSQSKSRHGNLQPRQHTLHVWRDNAWHEIASRSQVEGQVTAITQLDYDQFLRTVVLAQGQFDAFLKAGVNEKSALLEKITNTSIYSTLSARCYREFSRLDQETKRLEAVRNQLTEGLATQDPSTLETQLQTLSQAWHNTREAIQKQETMQAWWHKDQTLREEARALELENTHLEAVRTQAHQVAQTLKAHQEAATLVPAWTRLKHHEEALSKAQSQVVTLTEACLKADEALNLTQAQMQAQEKAHLEARQTYQADTERVQSAIALDAEIAFAKTQEVQQHEQLLDAQTRLHAHQEATQQAQARAQRLTHELEQLELTLAQNPCPLFVEQSEEHLWEVRRVWEKAEQEYASAQRQLEEARLDAQKHQEGLDILQQERLSAQAAQHTAQEALKEASTHVTTFRFSETQDFDQAYLALSAQQHQFDATQSYETQRAQLEPDTPCPLCGSVHHPYVEWGEEALHAKHEALLTQFKALSEERDRFNRAQRDLQTCALQLEAKTEALKRLDEARDGAVAAYTQKLQNVEQLLAHLKTLDDDKLAAQRALDMKLGRLMPETLTPESLDRLFAEARAFARALTQKTDRSQQAQELQETVKHLTAQTPALTELVQARAHALELAQNALRTKLEVRQAMFPETVEVFRKTLEARYQSALRTYEQAQATLQHAKDNALKAQTAMAQAKLALQTSQQEQRAAHTAWDEALAQQGLTQSQFEAHYLTPEALGHVCAKRDSLEKTLRDFENRQAQYKGKCEEHYKTPAPEASLEALEQTRQSLLAQERQTQAQLDALRLEWAKYQAMKTELEKLDTQLLEHRARVSPWEHLNRLMGSADGQKFRNYAQSITLKHLLVKANEMLALLNDRYQLTLNPDELLGLAIIDKHMGNILRTTHNLSGGESFMVSLSLALGLAQHGKGLGVNTLFLDEGFGTLDEEALSHALEMLSTLQEQGKMIGLISHVERLKEAIPTQIVLTPVAQTGHSTLSGPGVSGTPAV